MRISSLFLSCLKPFRKRRLISVSTAIGFFWLQFHAFKSEIANASGQLHSGDDFGLTVICKVLVVKLQLCNHLGEKVLFRRVFITKW